MQYIPLTIALLAVLLEGLDEAGYSGCGFGGGGEGVADEADGEEGEGDVEAFLVLVLVELCGSLRMSTRRGEGNQRRMTRIQSPQEHGGHPRRGGRNVRQIVEVFVTEVFARTEPQL